MIEVETLRELTLKEPIQSGRPSFLSAASGLVRVGEFLYVVADDENHLAVFREDDVAPGEVIRLFAGDLPVEKDARKKSKPDLEALTLLPTEGALLAIPSGSKPNRCTGALIPLDAKGVICAQSTLLDLNQAYRLIEAQVGPLNIEAVLAFESQLCLFNRGNKKKRNNSLIWLNRKPLLDSGMGKAALRHEDILSVSPLDLGEVNGVALTPTDAALLPSSKIVFTAAAEDTDSSYDDGECRGSAIGVVDRSGKVSFLETANTPRKLEGIAVKVRDGRLELLLVNDEDNHAHASELQKAWLPVQ